MIPAEKPASPAAAPRFSTASRAAVHFPEEASVPEHKRHLELPTLLYLVLGTLGREHTVGSEQFVYWEPTDPSRCLAPDAFVRLGVPDSIFGSWKTWERGVPEVALRDAEGRDLVLTPEETEARAREAADRAREAEARDREAADRAREAAEQRVAELEAQLRLRNG